MFLANDPQTGVSVFCEEDPRRDGFDGPIQEVELETAPSGEGWTGGTPQPQRYLGQDPHRPSRYRVFPAARDCGNAEFMSQGTAFRVVRNWRQYLAERQPGREVALSKSQTMPKSVYDERS